MVIRIRDIISLYNFLSDIKEKDFCIKTTWWASTNINRIKDNYLFFVNERNKIYEHCCYCDGDGNYAEEKEGIIHFNIKEGQDNIFSKRMNDLLDLDVEFAPYKLDMNWIIDNCDTFKIDPNIYIVLDYLFAGGDD